MPQVTAIPRPFTNGDVITQFVDTVGTTSTTYTFPRSQKKLKVKNVGAAGTGMITVTATGQSSTLMSGESHEFNGDIESFVIVSSGGVQSFEVTAMYYKDQEVTQLDNKSCLTKTLNKMLTGQTTKIVCYGDSITWGYQPSTGAKVANPYPSLLQTKLRDHYSNNNITVINEGHSGWQSDEALNNISLVLNASPDLAFVMFGINDTRGSSYGSTITLDVYKYNMEQLVKQLVDAGIEVVLLSSTPINDTNNSYNKKLILYTRAIKELADRYNVSFIDMQYEITKRFFTRSENATALFPDNIHFTDAKYEMLANIIMGQLLEYNNFSNVLYVNNRDEISIPTVFSPYVDTDCTNIFTHDGQFFQKNYILHSDSTTGTYLKFHFYIDKPGMDLILKSPKNSTGGQITANDNGVAVKTVDFYSLETHVFEAEDVLIENIAPGYHTIDFLTANSTRGQAGGAYGNLFFTEFKFRPTRQLNNKIYNTVAAGTFGTLEQFRKINDGVLRFTSSANTDTGAILLSKDNAELKTGKTLVIEAEGKFISGGGITWFGNQAKGDAAGDNPSLVNAGYLLYFQGSAIADAIRFYNMNGNNSYGAPLITGNVTIDYNVTHKIRITHTDTGLITVYLDGVQVLQATNTKARSGYFGLYTHYIGTLELTRYEYTHI